MGQKVPRKLLYARIEDLERQLHELERQLAVARGLQPAPNGAEPDPPNEDGFEPELEDFLAVAVLHLHDDVTQIRAALNLPACDPPRWLREGPAWVHPLSMPPLRPA